MTIFHMNCSTNGNEIKSVTKEKEGKTKDADCRSQLQKWPNNGPVMM